jgi:hypothetical protein
VMRKSRWRENCVCVRRLSRDLALRVGFPTLDQLKTYLDLFAHWECVFGFRVRSVELRTLLPLSAPIAFFLSIGRIDIAKENGQVSCARLGSAAFIARVAAYAVTTAVRGPKNWRNQLAIDLLLQGRYACCAVVVAIQWCQDMMQLVFDSQST